VSEPPSSSLLTQEFGVGNSACCVFMGLVRQPVVPGTLAFSIQKTNVIDRLAGLSGIRFIARDRDRDGVIHGERVRGTVNYQTGEVVFRFLDQPLEAGTYLLVHWRRELSPLHGCKIQVQMPDGSTRWATLAEINEALSLD